MTIIQTLTEKGFTPALEGGRLAVMPKAKLTDDLREFIRANKKRLISELKTQSSLVSSAFVSCQLVATSRNNDELLDIKIDYFQAALNRFINAGVKFEVSADDFQIIDGGQILKTSDWEFLNINSSDVLCHLQQSALMKHLFSHSPFLLNDFAFEIKERESLLTITAKTPFEIYCEAVKNVTKRWFADLLEKKTKQSKP